MMSQQEPNDEIENNEILENSADRETTAEPIDTLFSDESTDTSTTSTTSAFTSLRDDMEEQILDSTPTAEAPETDWEEQPRAGFRNMFWGALSCVGGIYITLISFVFFGDVYFYVLWCGPIIFGAIQFCRGLSQHIVADESPIQGGIADIKTFFALVSVIIGVTVLSVMTLDRRTQGITFSGVRELTSEQHFQAALDALHQRHIPDVITHRNALLMLPQQDDRISVLNAFIALTVDNLTVAAEHLKELQDSDDPLITTYLYYIAGELAFKQKQYGDSLQALNAAIEMSDQAKRKLVPAYQLMASIYYDLGNMQQAMNSATIVSNLDPTNARIFRFIGMVQQDYEQWQDSLIAYQRYLELDPFGDLRETVIISMAEVHIKLRQFNQALTQLNRVLVTPRIYALRASCHYNLGDVQDAFDALNNALTRDPAQHEAILLKGTIEVQDRSYKKAVDTFVSGLRYYPRDDVFMYKLSEAYRGFGDAAKAEELAVQSKILRTKRERFSKLNVDVIGEPTNIAMRLELGKLAEEIGKPELAVTWYQAVLTIDSQNQKALFDLERVIAEMTRDNTATAPFAPPPVAPQNPTTTPANQPNQ